MKNKFKILLITLLSIAIISLLYFFMWNFIFNPHRNVVTKFENSAPLSHNISQKEALEDLDFVYKKLKERHPIWLEKTEEAKQLQNLIATKYQNKKEILATKTSISVADLYQQVSEILALMKDGHTRCGIYTKEVKTIEDYTAYYAFGNPVAINGIDINQLYEVFKTRFSFEVDIAIKTKFFNKTINIRANAL